MIGLVVLQVAEQRDGLQGLAQTHLVGQDAVDAVLVEGYHPVEATDLVVTHLATLDVRRGGFEAEDGLVGGLLGKEFFVLFFLGLAVTVAKGRVRKGGRTR